MGHFSSLHAENIFVLTARKVPSLYTLWTLFAVSSSSPVPEQLVGLKSVFIPPCGDKARSLQTEKKQGMKLENIKVLLPTHPLWGSFTAATTKSVSKSLCNPSDHCAKVSSNPRGRLVCEYDFREEIDMFDLLRGEWRTFLLSSMGH